MINNFFQTDKALELLGKFEKIDGATLNINEKYMRVLANFGRDLESVRKQYQKGKDDPTVPRNIPPVAGKIAWARQLYRKIDIPMRAFKRKPDILKVRDSRYFLFSSENEQPLVHVSQLIFKQSILQVLEFS